jgi:hypothetical protein
MAKITLSSNDPHLISAHKKLLASRKKRNFEPQFTQPEREAIQRILIKAAMEDAQNNPIN